MNIKGLLTLALLVTSTLASESGSAAGTTAKAEAKSIRLCMPRGHEDLLNMALLVARDKKLFKQNNVNVEIKLIQHLPGKSGDNEYVMSKAGPVLPFNTEDWELTQMMLSQKNCDIAVSPAAGMLATQKTDFGALKPLYMTAYGTDYDTHLVVAADSKIKTAADLKGKVIRIGQVPTHIALYNYLKKSQVEMSDVTLQFKLASNFASEALADGTIDAAMTYVPTMPMMLASGKVRVLEQNIISKYVMPRTPNAILFTTAKFAKENPAVLGKFKKSVASTMEYINKNPAAVLQSATGFFYERHNGQWKGWKADPIQIERATSFMGKLTLESFDDPAEVSVIQKQLAEYQNLLTEMGYLSKKVDLSPWFAATTKQAAL